jgi:hypothetical protein
VRLAAEWNGHGMSATQSHAFEFADFPATRSFRRGPPSTVLPLCAWSAVTIGIVETAIEAARQQLARRSQGLRPYESVE